MKKHVILLLTAILTLLLCSCSSDEGKDTYFIHAMGIGKENEEYILLSVCEKLEKDEGEYFLIKQRGKNIGEALKKTRKEYQDCYFATAEYYFIMSDCDDSLIPNMAKEICDSNILPSKASICLVSGQDLESFMRQIKSGDDIKEIKKASNGKSLNAVSFFAKYTSGKTAKVPCLSRNDDGTITSKHTVFSKDKKGDTSEHNKR